MGDLSCGSPRAAGTPGAAARHHIADHDPTHTTGRPTLPAGPQLPHHPNPAPPYALQGTPDAVAIATPPPRRTTTRPTGQPTLWAAVAAPPNPPQAEPRSPRRSCRATPAPPPPARQRTAPPAELLHNA
ncbi:hypothetical protein GCM10010218_30260 [Streptomyces mashuensis]|uniref:Uncharacterized protein n=1 Tax=Streptomyces mashuensis TaxID=33904 RepID=A0A919B372_9ACTN|nr:hypothetical protein GCM10010218_30260 [Streptomyces mashuensis]